MQVMDERLTFMSLVMRGRAPLGIGYEGQSLHSLTSDLAGAGVDVVADVRLTPISRKPGFSKTALSEALESVGMQYLHLAILGNPKQNRAGFGGSAAERRMARARYQEFLDADEQRGALDHLSRLAMQGTLAVLCFEADQSRCHRDLVLAALHERLVTGGQIGVSGSTRQPR